MNLPPARICPRFASGLLAAALLCVSTGCKPAPPAGSIQATDAGQPTPKPGGSNAVHPPTAADLQVFFQGLCPAFIRVTEVKTDPPVQMPNTSPADHVWLLQVKLVLTPTEDLLALGSTADVQPYNDLVAELNGLVAWRNAYVRSSYARAYGPCEVQVPASAVPQLLVITQAKDQPLAAIYGKMAATWQVDHWLFEEVDLQVPAVGKPRSAFGSGPTMVKGSPQAEAFLAAEQKAIADAKAQQAAIEDRYAKDLAASTRAGTVYQGQVSYARGVLPCEVRLTETPGADPLTATFELRLPQRPTYLFTYVAKLAPRLPLNISQDDAAPSSPPAVNSDRDPSVGNLMVSCVRHAGQPSTDSNLPGLMVSGTYVWNDRPFLLIDGHLKGAAASFNGIFFLQADKR